METSQQSTSNSKEFEVTGVSRSGRVRKKSSKLLDFQSPDDVEKRIFKRTTASSGSRHSSKNINRTRPNSATLKTRRGGSGMSTGQSAADIDDVAVDDEELENDSETDVTKQDMDVPAETNNSDDDNIADEDDNDNENDDDDGDDNFDDVLANNENLTANSDSDDGFGELVADLVGSEGPNNNDSKVRRSLYMTEKRSGKDGGRLERKDKGKQRYTAYSLWAREYRKSSKFSNEVDFSTARRELWANVSNKEKNIWRRKAKIQATKAKALEKSGGNSRDGKKPEKSNDSTPASANSTFINRPTTSRTKKLAEDKQKAKDDMAVEVPSSSSTPKRSRTTSYNRRSAPALASTSATKTKSDLKTVNPETNGSSNSNTNPVNTNNSINMPLPTIEPIDAAAHLKLLGESLTIIGDRLKEHEGQIAVSGSLSVLLDSLLCSLGPLLCLTTNLPGLDKKPQLKANLATTLDNIAYVMPGL